MKLFNPYSLGTNICKGYELDEALDIVKESGFECAELSSIVNMCEHINPDNITPEYAQQVKEMLEKKGMSCYAVSGHVDLTEDKQFHDFLKKVEFAGRIGAHIINTNSGPKSRRDVFYKNMSSIIKAAEKWNVVIGLESHGDIVDTAQDSVEVFEYFHHPLVRLNYDTGNTLFYSEGKVKIEEDIKYGLPYLEHLHLKDIKIEGNNVRYCPIGEGDVNFPAVFDVLKSLKREIPCGLEIPVHVRGVLGKIVPVGTPMPREDIVAAVRSSTNYIDSIL